MKMNQRILLAFIVSGFCSISYGQQTKHETLIYKQPYGLDQHLLNQQRLSELLRQALANDFAKNGVCPDYCIAYYHEGERYEIISIYTYSKSIKTSVCRTTGIRVNKSPTAPLINGIKISDLKVVTVDNSVLEEIASLAGQLKICSWRKIEDLGKNSPGVLLHAPNEFITLYERGRLINIWIDGTDSSDAEMSNKLYQTISKALTSTQ